MSAENTGSATVARRSWPFFSTPLRYFLLVFVPICGLMGPLAVLASRWGLRASAGVVLACSFYALGRGYLCRVAMDLEGVEYRSAWRRLRIGWGDVREIGRYSAGAGGASYVFVSRRSGTPGGRWEIDADTIQLQDRPGLVETLRQGWETARSGLGRGSPVGNGANESKKA